MHNKFEDTALGAPGARAAAAAATGGGGGGGGRRKNRKSVQQAVTLANLLRFNS